MAVANIEFYENFQEKYSILGLSICAIETNAKEAERILEVACGPGTHSLMLS